MIIREATKEDCLRISEIYNYYIENTAITYEYEKVSSEEMFKRMSDIQRKLPFLVCTINDDVVGYAYSKQYIEREACKYSVELSVYVDKDYLHKGIGKNLYLKMEDLLKQKGIVNLYVSIAHSENNDPYVDDNSLDFHKHMGYKLIGNFENCGYKFNRWYDLLWLGKTINDYQK